MLEAIGYDVVQSPLRARERPHGHGIPISEQVKNTLLGKIESAQRECEFPIVVVADTLVEDPDDALQHSASQTIVNRLSICCCD